MQEAERPRWHCVRCGSLLPTGWDEAAPALTSNESISAMKLLVLACARPRQSLWQLPPPAARYMHMYMCMCAAVVYTPSRSCSLLDTWERYDLSCPLAQRFSWGGAEQGWASEAAEDFLADGREVGGVGSSD